MAIMCNVHNKPISECGCFDTLSVVSPVAYHPPPISWAERENWRATPKPPKDPFDLTELVVLGLAAYGLGILFWEALIR